MSHTPDTPKVVLPRDPVAYPRYPARPITAARPIFTVEEEALHEHKDELV